MNSPTQANQISADHTPVDYAPSMSKENAIKKAAMLATVRAFFAKRNVLEITTPILSQHGNTDVFIESVQASVKRRGKPSVGFLHTSPEFAMKRVLAAYQLPIFQLCQVFRDNEIGHKHNVEFTMLEWYRPHFSLEMLADELLALLEAVYDKPMRVRHYRYAQAFVDVLGLHPFSASVDELRACARQHGLTLEMGDDVQGWLDLLFSHLIEPDLGRDVPTLLTDYPPATAALAKIATDQDGFEVAKRFELYIDGVEIANAYDELADSKALRQRFCQDNAQRAALGLPTMPIDENLLRACDDLPPCSGIALGVDRLFMVKEGLTDISQAVLFVSDKA
ncbi:EF-P lysine aminoacylase GenX [Moraxella caviae]|uniref:EF-P lysine aminoacylase GenX n=1 Tax=Moraxella caviae TaxID=34060 RepID=A0A1S9ZUK2_9GAMM|nr:EF-P lysine aminoacylase EpmA [Moraxella caviae]OOR87073.1 EF-P lysine aminoacylase GenX [Moraxella caviae]STZ13811.1 poxB regulator PoxA [Moraxella caviae]VEW10612.1 poxB regulator PoxA [Moraxella caviae]